MPGLGKAALAVCLAAVPVVGVHAQTAAADATPKASFATLEAHGEQRGGLWIPVYGSGRPFFVVEEIAFKPWAKGLFDSRQQHDLEPHARCKPSGAIRQFLTPYGVEIVEIEPLERIYIFDIGGPHAFREVFMDGRSHPAEPPPSYYGHNIGWWEGDTLVVDSVGYNEGFWFERMGLPHTEAVHITEYFRRVDAETVEYTFLMEDTTAYDAPVEGHMTLRWREGEELFEYMCQQANYATELMINPENPEAARTSPIVP